MPTHYDTLNVPNNATPKQIKKAYRCLIVKHHPDKNLNNKEQATEKTKQLNAAYEALGDPESRQKYDEELNNPTPPPANEDANHTSTEEIPSLAEYFAQFFGSIIEELQRRKELGEIAAEFAMRTDWNEVYYLVTMQKASVTESAENGDYPIHSAIRHANLTAVNFLLLNGAKTHHKTIQGENAAHLSARICNNYAIAKAIGDAAAKEPGGIIGRKPPLEEEYKIPGGLKMTAFGLAQFFNPHTAQYYNPARSENKSQCAVM